QAAGCRRLGRISRQPAGRLRQRHGPPCRQRLHRLSRVLGGGKVMMRREDAIRSTYAAYNARDLLRALANLSADVDWDDGEGNMLHGKDAVARHWADQW